MSQDSEECGIQQKQDRNLAAGSQVGARSHSGASLNRKPFRGNAAVRRPNRLYATQLRYQLLFSLHW